METIILTSSGKFIFENDINEFLPKKISSCKIAYITTALKKTRHPDNSEKRKVLMDEREIDYTDIDIAGKNEAELEALLPAYDIVFVEGGNAYHLLNEIRKSGFARVIKELIKKGVVYIGSSAGSYVATPSIITATWSERGHDRCGITDFTAMSLAPFLMKAHFIEKKREEWKEKAKVLKLPLRVLTDKQALLIRNGEVKLIGDGEEVVL